jgi:hypothetical protein
MQLTDRTTAASTAPAQQLQDVTYSSTSSSARLQQQQQEKSPAAGLLHAVIEYQLPDRPEAPLPVTREGAQGRQSSAIAVTGKNPGASERDVAPVDPHSVTSSGGAADSNSGRSVLRLGGSDGSSNSSSSSMDTDRRLRLRRRLLRQKQLAASGGIDESWQVDVLVVVTPAAAAAGGGGIDAVATAAALAVAKANKAYIDSQVNVQLNLKAVRQVSVCSGKPLSRFSSCTHPLVG